MDDFKKYLNQHRDELDTDVPGDHVWEKLRNDLEPAKGLVIPMLIKWAAAACIILLAGFGAYVLVTDDKKQDIAQNAAPAKIDTAIDRKQQPTQPANDLAEQRSIALKEAPKHGATSNRKGENIAAGQLDRSLAKKDAIVATETPTQKPADPLASAFRDMEASYASMVNIQLEKVKGTPIYAEDANYFHLFKKQFQDLSNDEKLLKDETKKNGINDDIITRMINVYQEKINLLKQLQFEINKMNNRVKNAETDVQKQTPTYINL